MTHFERERSFEFAADAERIWPAIAQTNLVTEIMGVGFDYGMSAADVARGVVAGHQILWSRELELPAPDGS